MIEEKNFKKKLKSLTLVQKLKCKSTLKSLREVSPPGGAGVGLTFKRTILQTLCFGSW